MFGHMRLITVSLTTLVVVGLLGACSPQQATPDVVEVVKTVVVEQPVVETVVVKEEVVVTATPVVEGKPGGTLVLGKMGDILNFNAFNLQFASYPVFHQLYDTLILYDPEKNIMPRLAESWAANEEGTQLTLNLRQGVRWHNGREFVADDVVANFELASDETTGRNMHAKVKNVENVTAPDDYTVVIDFKSPTPDMFDILDAMSLMAPETFDSLDTMAIGTGPFKFVEWIPGDHVALVRNDDYWEEGYPYLDEVIIKAYSDQQALVTAVETGVIDVAVGVPMNDLQRLEDANVATKRGQTGASLYTVTINPPDPDQEPGPLSDKRVRQAINYALDRETIVEQALFGVGMPTQVTFPTYSLGYFEEYTNRYPFDLDKAEELLAEAGYPDGGFELTAIYSSAYPEIGAMAQILQADLAKLGVDLKIEPLDSAAYNPRHLGSPETNGSGDFDLDFTFVGRTQLDPLGLFDNSPYRPRNSPVFPREDFPEGYVEALKAAGETIDKEERRQYFQQVAEIISEECVDVPISWRYVLFSYQPCVNGFDWDIQHRIRLAYTWLDN